jgi:NADH-quinone oxidoreductase subunit L
MTTTYFLQLFIFIPLAGLIIGVLLPRKKESLLSGIGFITVGLHLIVSIAFVLIWLIQGRPILNLKDIVLYQTDDYAFYIDFCFDKITMVYLLVGSFLTFLVTIYSKAYMHREPGYKRFFSTILLFYLGYNITIFSGNFETLFLGWEILGISSFMLIAFYRDRYLPVKNAVKVFSIYRISDIGIILAMWASHDLWHENITFTKLNNAILVHEHLEGHSLIGVFISIMILVTATAKSAQLPFSSWLPRAMEGPTPSSAIFYGSLSVHIGVFLLLRTFPFWENQISVRILIATLGLSTSIVTSLIARVQSSVKSQIAYASIAQIGLIFIEVAAGFEDLALIHFAGNAFLRTYQLLVSPSVVSYLIREQFFNFIPRKQTLEDSFPKKMEYTFYILSLKEWNLDYYVNRYLWKPLKFAGRKLGFIRSKQLIFLLIPIFLVGSYLLFNDHYLPQKSYEYLAASFAFIGLLLTIRSFTERSNVIFGWSLLVFYHFWIALAVAYNTSFDVYQTIMYLSGVIFAGLVGYIILLKLKSVETQVNLDTYYGHSYEHPKLAGVFLLACLGLNGFPITTTFIGEDLNFRNIHQDQFALATFISLAFITSGVSLIRMYARIFLGPHVKTYHETPFKTS